MSLRHVADLMGLTAAILLTSAHVGSPDAWLEGSAGPYPVVVNVRVPGVVPGIATVYVRIAGDAIGSVQQVAASGTKFDATAASPPAEIATPVAGDPSLYQVSLWMMARGSNSVTVFVRGTRGTGKIVVPVVILAQQRLVLNRPLGVALAAMGILLFLGAISIVGSMAREAVLAPEVAPNPARYRQARWVMGATAIVLATLVLGGWHWWDVKDRDFLRTLYKPMTSRAAVHTTDGVNRLDFVITDSLWAQRHDTAWTTRRNMSFITPIVPDHGKLMHLFLIRESDRTVFAHLHPTTTDSITFSTVLPSLPPGRYRAFADVVRESGYAETMTTVVDLPAQVGNGGRTLRAADLGDLDDSWYVGSSASNDTAVLADGSVMHWDRGTTRLIVDRVAPLSFTVTDAHGQPQTLEPYMGMAAHAVVLRSDGAVFVHLHPSGTVSMGAQETFALRRATDTVPGMVAQRMRSEMVMPMSVTGNTVRFPYSFPKSGRYYIWVQVKRMGRILTGMFETNVGT